MWERASGRGKGSQHAPQKFGVDTDAIFYYGKTDKHKPIDICQRLTDDETMNLFPKTEKGTGRRYNTGTPIFCSASMGARPNLCYTYKGVYPPSEAGWRVSRERLKKMDKEGRIIWRKDQTPLRKAYADEYKGKPMGSLWTDINNLTGESTERVGYPTQKPVELLRRIINACSNKGDMVLDPFCGCATACIAAEQLERQWIGIDISKKAYELVNHRIKQEVESDLFGGEAIYRTDIPDRTDDTADSRYEVGKHKNSIKKNLYGVQEGNCAGCSVHFDGVRHFDLDHIVPRAKGGGDNFDNFQLLCGSCNSIKGDRDMAFLRSKLRKDGFINK